MTKTISALIAATLFAGAASADKVAFACQYDVTGGFKWENGSWVLKHFQTDRPMVIVLENGLISDETQNKNQWLYKCKKTTFSSPLVSDQTIVCFDELGGYLMFDPATGLGARAEILGAVVKLDSNQRRDTLSVRTFTCTKF